MPIVAEIVAGGCAGQPGVPLAQELVRKVKAALGKPVLRCDELPAILQKGIPLPGSKEFCEVIPDFEKALEDLGNKLLSLIVDNTKSVITLRFLRLPAPALTDNVVVSAIVTTWNKIIDGIGNASESIFNTITDQIKTVWTVYQCLTARLKPGALFAITVLKSVVHSLDRLRLGTDFVLWATADTTIAIDAMKRLLDMLERYYAPLEVPSPEMAWSAWFQQRITEKQRDCICLLSGQAPETFEPFRMVEEERTDWREAIQYIRRIQGDGGNERALLRERGWVTKEQQDQALELYDELPGIADHLHWLAKNVFDDEYVKKYELMSGFTERFWKKFGHDLRALGMKEEYARLHYAAHWQMPAPEQMREFVYRLRPQKAEVTDSFDADDFGRILQEQDYNPLAVKWFKQTLYNVPSLSMIHEWFDQYEITDEQFVSYYRDHGYTTDDANRQLKLATLARDKLRISQSQGWTPTVANSAFAAGVISEEEHSQIYQIFGYGESEAMSARQVAQRKLQTAIVSKARAKILMGAVQTVRTAVDVGAMDQAHATQALVNIGYPPQMASGVVQLESSKQRAKLLNGMVNYVKRQYLDGAINSDQAAAELAKAGVVGTAIQQYLALWAMELTPKRKRRSAGQAVSDYANGRMSREEATVRIQNLGYDDADTRLYLAEAQEKLQKIEQGRLKAAEKSGLAKSKQLAALAKQADRQRKEIVRAMTKEIPVAKLMRWAKLGIIGKDLFTARMTLYGYVQPDIDRYYKDACSSKTAACVDNTPGETTSNGGSGASETPGK
jgi:hypothetical protein